MAYTTNYNLPEMPTGPVDWPAVFNELVHKLEVGRTFKVTAGESLVKGNAIFIDDDGKAYKADGTTNKAQAIWQSASTSANAEGYAQTDGTMVTGSWTSGGLIYSSATGELTQTVNGPILGFAKSPTEIVINIHLS